MYQTITQSDFINTFQNIRPENFSVAALESLYDFIEELENDTGEQSEFDPIALCCDWAEYTEAEIRREYTDIVEDCEDLEDMVEALNEHTMVIETRDNTLLVLAF